MKEKLSVSFNEVYDQKEELQKMLNDLQYDHSLLKLQNDQKNLSLSTRTPS